MAVLRELEFYGLLIPPLLVWAFIALVLAAALRRALELCGAYGYVWHRSLFDTALLMIVLGGVAAISAWLQVL